MTPPPCRLAGAPITRRTPLVAAVIPTLAVVFAIGASGCASDSSSTRNAKRSPAPTGDLLADVEAQYLIGPAAAQDLGYRVSWQFPTSGRPIRQAVVQGDSVFVLDNDNVLTRIRREEGDRVWRIPIADPIERIFGITYVPSTERIYLTTGSDIYVLDAASGHRIARQRLTKIANTKPILHGQFLVYGARNGQLTWHSYELGTLWRGYQISQSIQVPPVYHEGYFVAVGNDGKIMCLRAGSASQVWSRSALDAIVARPTAGHGAVYVASLDQHLRAFELAARRSPLWEHLTESPLRDSPVLIDDYVYQRVPDVGLVCFEALPLDSPGGVVVWTATEASGNVVAQRGRNLIVWDGIGHRIEVLDSELGAVIDGKDMLDVVDVFAIDTYGSELYATGTDGRITRLVPRHRN